MDAAFADSAHADYSRASVYRPDWDKILNTFKSVAGCEVTRRTLSLGDADSVTGWFEKSWSETTIEGLLVPSGAQSTALAMGTVVRLDALLRLADGMLEGDEVEDSNGDYYEVKTVTPHSFGDSFWFRECDLALLPHHDLTYTRTTPTVDDARARTKDYWGAYILEGNLNGHSFHICYSGADYPVIQVFRSKGYDIVFTVDVPETKPLFDVDQVPYNYEELVPTHVFTLDTNLQWLAELELRRIVEAYPRGSQRGLERLSTTIHSFGSTKVYDTTFMLNYMRDTS